MPHIVHPDPETSVTVETIDEVIHALSPQFGPAGLATRRSVDEVEIKEAHKALPAAKQRVRVYSAAGFVPNSYRYRCDIQFVEAIKVDDETWDWNLSWGRAQRSNGRASRKVVQ